MGISSSMYVALTGLRVSQAAMETASHNIANVNTVGYSRQRVNVSTLPTQSMSYGQLGLGAQIDNVSRYHDQFLTRSLIMTGSTLGHDVALKSAMDNLELFFNESDGGGINQAMNDFFASWEQLADEPSNKPTREELVQYTESLAKQIALRRNDLDALRVDTNKRIDDGVKEVNTLIGEIARLNQEITVVEDPTLNREANDLRDTREELTRQLGEYMNIEYYEDPHDGQWTITASNGIPLVLKDRAFTLTTNTKSNGDVEIRTTHNQYWLEEISPAVTTGAIGGWLEFRDVTLDDAYKQFDSFADGLIFAINDQHAQGAGQSLFTEAQATTLNSNRAYLEVDFAGDDNGLRLSSWVPHVTSKEPYGAYDDPDNISVKFQKAEKNTSEITSEVIFNNDPAVTRWEITITLPVDRNGHISATAQDVAEYINSERSTSALDGLNYLPPRTSQWKVGDFLAAEGVSNDGMTGLISFDGATYPVNQGQYLSLSRDLRYTLPQGHHLSYGLDYAQLTTTFKHTNNDLTFTAIAQGAAGENLAVEFVSAGANQPLRVSVIDAETGIIYTDPNQVANQVPSPRLTLSVQLATDANGQILTTAGDVVAAVNSHNVARTLVAAQTPTEETGLGLVEEMDKTYLDRSGYFTVVVYPENGEPQFHQVTVNPTDTMADVISQIGDTFDSGIPGLRIEMATDRHGQDSLRLIADDNVQFGFAGDNSGFLAAMGLNTILTGSNGANIGVNQTVVTNRNFLNAGHIDSNGVIAEGDNVNALGMTDVKDRRYAFYHQPQATLGTEFNAIYANIGSQTQAATRDYEFTENLMTGLQDRQDSIAGVNLDEELANILKFQYMYQASAKIISTIDSMMETLLAMR
ncbi:MAG: flagellar hook-associated protein FlgK [Deltaproteobacteria bacterium]|jgi:flagellar hook-associated protein 1 FlgK|nr:flagellar hook-associated protein FlgK [Deltaproteobacteria bacterium]